MGLREIIKVQTGREETVLLTDQPADCGQEETPCQSAVVQERDEGG